MMTLRIGTPLPEEFVKLPAHFASWFTGLSDMVL
jgi:hypothetical protein